MVKNYFLFGLFFVFFSYSVHSQHLYEVEFLQSLSQEQVNNQIPIEASNGLDFYKMKYFTTGSDGLPDTASGLVVIPIVDEDDHPLVIYHHGTTATRDHVPSNLNISRFFYHLLGGTGFAMIAPDYIGMGESRGFHPYVHRETQASASIDMLKAYEEWLAETEDGWNGQLFLTGYSQGGQAGMATHWELETNYSEQYEVTAASHLSGPYSLSTVMTDLMLSEQDYQFIGFAPYAILGLQEVYGNIFEDLNEIFKDSYVPHIESFYNGDTDLFTLTGTMLNITGATHGNIHPVHVFQPEFVEDLQNNPDNTLKIALENSDTYDWSPQSPTRLVYCEADDQVPFENSILAEETMVGNGAVDLEAVDVDSDFNHTQCVLPAGIETLNFFNSFLGTSVGDQYIFSEVNIYPNPSSGMINIQTGDEVIDYQIELYNLTGKLLIRGENNNSLDLGHLENGMYLLRMIAEDGIFTQKVNIVR